MKSESVKAKLRKTKTPPPHSSQKTLEHWLHFIRFIIELSTRTALPTGKTASKIKSDQILVFGKRGNQSSFWKGAQNQQIGLRKNQTRSTLVIFFVLLEPLHHFRCPNFCQCHQYSNQKNLSLQTCDEVTFLFFTDGDILTLSGPCLSRMCEELCHHNDKGQEYPAPSVSCLWKTWKPWGWSSGKWILQPLWHPGN